MARLLIVDDDEDFRDAYAMHFTQEGHDVFSVASGEAALEALKRQPCDLIVVDLLLPGMDGAELCRMVRADQELCRLPVVMISAMARRMGIQITGADGMWAPVDCFLEKEVSLDTLSKAVAALLTRGTP